MGKLDRRRAPKSIVVVHRTPECAGLGFVVGGRYIITAAHCLPKMPDRDDPGSDLVAVNIRGLVRPLAARAVVIGADSCLDVAILSDRTLNGRDLPARDQRDLSALFRGMESASPNLEEQETGTTFGVCIYSHERRWLSGTATVLAPNHHRLSVTFRPKMCPGGGTSGSPVLDGAGRVVGLVSMVGGLALTEEAAATDESADVVRLAAALPGWMLRELR